MSKLSTSLLLLVTSVIASEEQVSVANSCRNLPDGDHWLKFINEDSYPVIQAQCSNGYAIIDYNKDDDWELYFSSFKKIHYAAGGPTKDDHSNWDEWFTPDLKQFVVAPDCQSCDERINLQQYDTTTAYYSTSHFAGAAQQLVAHAACDMRWDDYACQYCTEDTTTGSYTSALIENGLIEVDNDTISVHALVGDASLQMYNVGSCPFIVGLSTTPQTSADSFEALSKIAYFGRNSKPSLGLNSKFCVCASSAEPTQYYQVSQSELEEKESKLAESNGADDADDDSAPDAAEYYLYASDFADGTYRITKSGTYYVMEDITFDMKGLSLDDTDEPLSQSWNGNPDAWWPTEDDSDKYEGAGGLSGAYWTGFFAGIAIETSDVVLDLGGHTLQMSETFYYQQSFFAHIALMSQTFLPIQGFANFGTDPQFAENIVIRNGNLGLSSHWGIQGLKNANILIEDLKIYDFKTHGIGINGFDGVTVRNVEIGPNVFVDKLRPFYSQIRHFLGVFRQQIDDPISEDVCLSFTNRESCITMPDLYDELVTAMDMAFEYAVLDRDWDALIAAGEVDDAELIALWERNKKAFISEGGTPETSGLFALFFNYPAANNRFWYTSTDAFHSTDLHVENVYIHDLEHSGLENVGIDVVLNPLQGMINVELMFGAEKVDTISEYLKILQSDDATAEEMSEAEQYILGLEYVGSTSLDMHIFSYELVRNYAASWNYISAPALHFSQFVDWALGANATVSGGYDSDTMPSIDMSFEKCCSQDAMGHPGKGVIGVRIVGVDGVNVEGLTIENLHSYTPLGSTLCGDEESGVSVQKPYMDGFTMNRAIGMDMTHVNLESFDNVRIDNIASETGLAWGVSLWFSEDTAPLIGESIAISDINAGITVEKGSLQYESGSNRAPEACAMRIYSTGGIQISDENDQLPQSKMWSLESVSGEYGCGGVTDTFTSMGTVTVTPASSTSTDSSSGLVGYIWFIAGAMLISVLIIATCIRNGGSLYTHKVGTPFFTEESQLLLGPTKKTYV